MAELSESTQNKIRQFQELQQTARIFASQKFQFDAQIKEVKNALAELEKADSPEVYKAVGQIIIKAEKSKLISELKEKIETLDLRLKALEKQEKKSVEKLQGIQAELEKEFSGLRGASEGGAA